MRMECGWQRRWAGSALYLYVEALNHVTLLVQSGHDLQRRFVFLGWGPLIPAGSWPQCLCIQPAQLVARVVVGCCVVAQQKHHVRVAVGSMLAHGAPSAMPQTCPFCTPPSSRTYCPSTNEQCAAPCPSMRATRLQPTHLCHDKPTQDGAQVPDLGVDARVFGAPCQDVHLKGGGGAAMAGFWGVAGGGESRRGPALLTLQGFTPCTRMHAPPLCTC